MGDEISRNCSLGLRDFKAPTININIYETEIALCCCCCFVFFVRQILSVFCLLLCCGYLSSEKRISGIIDASN